MKMNTENMSIPVEELASFADDLMKRNKNVDTAIEDFLVKMASFFDVDIIVVKEKMENGAVIKCTYEWSRKNLLQLQGLERRFLDSVWEEWEKRYREGGGAYRYYRGDECPIVLIHYTETESLVQIPVYKEDELVACVDFVDSEERRSWRSEEVSAMGYICTYMYREMFMKRAPRRDAEV